MQPFHDINELPRPVVAISACLAGDNVRYDGAHKLQPLLLRTLSTGVQWLRICPEVAAGMGIPRPPVQLRRHGNDIAVVEVDDPTRDHTARLQHGVDAVTQQLLARPPTAIVLKARSPSCGTGTTTLFNDNGDALMLTDGVFAHACRQHFPATPLFDEAAFVTRTACQAFALSLLIHTDIARVDTIRRNALDSHYRGFDINTQLQQTLLQQLNTWSPQRVEQVFDANWSALQKR